MRRTSGAFKQGRAEDSSQERRHETLSGPHGMLPESGRPSARHRAGPRGSSPQQGLRVADELPCRLRWEASRRWGQYATLSGSRATNQPLPFVVCSNRLHFLVPVQASAAAHVVCQCLTPRPAPGVDRVDSLSLAFAKDTPGDRRTLQAARPFNQLEGSLHLGRSGCQADRSTNTGKWCGPLSGLCLPRTRPMVRCRLRAWSSVLNQCRKAGAFLEVKRLGQ